jgi:hypothetical protein
MEVLQNMLSKLKRKTDNQRRPTTTKAATEHEQQPLAESGKQPTVKQAVLSW